MSNEQRLFNLMARFVMEATFRTTYPARLGKGDGETLWVSGRPNYVWARIQYPDGKSTSQIRAHRINAAYGAPVEVRVARDGELEAIGSDGTEISQFAASTGFVLDMPTHAVTHQYNGSDPMLVDSRQVSPLRVRVNDTAGLSVYVDACVYTDTTGTLASFDGGTIDLTSKVPSSTGHQVIILVGLDKSTGTLTTVDGTSAFYSYDNLVYVPFTRAEVLALSLPANFEPGGAVRLYTGQSRIDMYDIFMDARAWFGGTGTSYGLSLQPTLISSDYTIPANYQAIWARGRTIASGGSITVSGDEYILNA